MARIKRSVLAQELDELVHLLEQHPAGMSRTDLEQAYAARYGRELGERTLRRRLETLVAGHRIAVSRESSAPMYRVSDAATSVTGAAGDEVPLTAEGLAVRALMRRPMTQRPPVGYDREFLFAYTPGETWYLPSALRRRLHDMGRTPGDDRPADTFARDILSRLLIDLSWASSRLEGNTYSRLDTQNLIEFGQQAEGKDAEETQMILNHKTAIELLVAEAEAPAFPRMLLRGIHAALSENLLGNPADEGRLRTRFVDITRTSYTPIAIPQVIEDCTARIIDTVSAIADPFEQAFFLMVHIPYLQPFVDVNKRTSRLAANWPLLHGNLCPLSFVDVPEHAYVEGTLAVYELRRVELLRDVFAWAYERSCAQYHVVKDSLPQPDALRLRYRNELRAVVQGTVRDREPPQVGALRTRGSSLGVAPEDLDGFAERALAELLNLHEGSVSRYQLRPAELTAWRALFHVENPKRVQAATFAPAPASSRVRSASSAESRRAPTDIDPATRTT